MWKLGSLLSLLFLCSAAALISARGSTNTTSIWQTLTGDAPLVIARGGFSGIFPDSSYNAYAFAYLTSLPGVVAWCDVQLTKDGKGICFPDVKLDNASTVAYVFPSNTSTYLVNGDSTEGWFSIDFTSKELTFVYLTQGVYSRSSNFNPQQILTVEDMFNQVKPPGLWLNVQRDLFYKQHNLSMRSFVLSVSKSIVVKYISSPEVNFLKSIMARFNPKVTKLVFRFLGQDEIEPSTNQTYGSLQKNLTYIKTFASGSLVPKGYIWPLDNTLYLLPHTSIVSDAHKEGLEVYASDFFNDVPFAYNYSYDPLAEYLSFIDNGDFSVDGVLSDFPITPSAAIDCYSHMGNNDKPQGLLVISSQGASGDFPGCTDKAYSQAISDGVDVLDCPVQMSKDGKLFCLGSINMIEWTTAAQSFGDLATSIPDLDTINAIHSFNLTWAEIQTLRPSISNPYSKFKLQRNPRSKYAGNFTTLDDFLALSKNATSVSGVLIRVENAAYLAEKLGLSVTDAVLDSLSRGGYNNLTEKKVMIQSSSSAVLMKFVNKNYERVYGIYEDIRDIENSTILDIKKLADSIVITKESVFPTYDKFLAEQTNLVTKLHEFKLNVYVQLFTNEFVSQAWDFFSDASVEINTFVYEAGVDGVITDFPATANRYRRNRCLGYKNTPPYMLAVSVGGLLQLTNPQPPAEAPNPVLTESDVVQPPLPPAGNRSVVAAGPIPPPPPPPTSGQFSIAAASISTNIILAVLVAVVT